MGQLYMPEYGFLFEEKRENVPGFGEMITLLAPGEELLMQREALGLTQQQVADRAKMNVRQYQRFESGERSLYSASFRMGLNICYVLKIDPMYYCSIHKLDQIEENQKANLTRHFDSPAEINGTPDKEPPQRCKYLLYSETEDGDPEEIIAVEHGCGIESVYDQLTQAIRDDLSEDPQFKGCEIDIYSYEQLEANKYTIQTVIRPPYAESNILIEYLVIESSDTP